MKINGKEVKIPEVDFACVVFMEEHGTPIGDSSVKKKVFSLARNFVAYALHIEPENANYLMQQHVLAGNSFDELYDAIGNAITESSFLSKMAENANKKENQEKKEKKLSA